VDSEGNHIELTAPIVWSKNFCFYEQS
jgi:hypothetical protein